MNKLYVLLNQLKNAYIQAETKFLALPINQQLDKYYKNLVNGFHAARYVWRNSYTFQKYQSYTWDFTKGLLGSIFIMHFINIYQDRWHKQNQFIDQVTQFFYVSGNLELRMGYAYDSILEQSLKQGKQDANVWVSIGQIYSQGQEPEFSYSAYYIAHLKEHKKIKTNSDLQFETIAKINAGQKKNPLGGFGGNKDINQMLETISN